MSESETDNERPVRVMTESLPRRPIDGIGPMTKDGMPLVLRSVSTNFIFYYIKNNIIFFFRDTFAILLKPNSRT